MNIRPIYRIFAHYYNGDREWLASRATREEAIAYLRHYLKDKDCIGQDWEIREMWIADDFGED